jgi:hypothetical protein
VKAGGKQSDRLAESLDYTISRSEMEDIKSVPVGSPVGQNEPPIPIGSHTQPSEPIRDKNVITSMPLKRASYAGLGEDKGEVVCGGQRKEEYG